MKCFTLGAGEVFKVDRRLKRGLFSGRGAANEIDNLSGVEIVAMISGVFAGGACGDAQKARPAWSAWYDQAGRDVAGAGRPDRIGARVLAPVAMPKPGFHTCWKNAGNGEVNSICVRNGCPDGRAAA